jgi:hypothetical protein
MTTIGHSPFPNPGASPPKSPWGAIAITLVSAILLGAGSCFGFLTTLTPGGRNSGANTLFMYVFLICPAVFVGGLIWAFVTLIRKK